ncbi:hypothetical protein [Streptomyces sp. NBC_00448]|uniref:hypothetical protein n=1 Tax=Streptomyces sp. NBC_00448 TaxID=2903652 RepID=UPI002E1F996E
MGESATRRSTGRESGAAAAGVGVGGANGDPAVLSGGSDALSCDERARYTPGKP